MSKMIIMRGLPASGKSTRAAEIIEKTGNFVRINKDLLRTMLHFDKFTGHNEGLTREAARTLARHYLTTGTNVIIDDTNLNPGTFQSWVDLAKEAGAKHEVEDVTTGWHECCMRDMARMDHVGNHVIKNMALQYGLMDQPAKPFVLCDIDGTIADPTHRLHFVHPPEGQKKDWKSFFAHMGEDPVRREVADKVIDYYNQGHNIIYFSARPENYRDVTLEWLHKNALSFALTLIMRPAGDKRPDIEVKQELYNKYLKDKYPIEVVIDDRPSVIRMWRENGLNVMDVGGGVEF